jgi:hypothetical protein
MVVRLPAGGNFPTSGRPFHPSAARSSNFHATRPRGPQKNPKKHKLCMEVFNSSVENRVEKAAARIETAHYYGAYSCLHKFCADFCPSELREATLH